MDGLKVKSVYVTREEMSAVSARLRRYLRLVDCPTCEHDQKIRRCRRLLWMVEGVGNGFRF